MASNDVPAVQTEAQISPPPTAEPPVTAAAYISRDLAPPSSRSSFTRVEDEDERRTVQITSHDPVSPLSTLPTLTLSPIASNTYIDDQTTPLVSKSSVDQQPFKPPVDSAALPELAMDEHVPQMPQTYLTFLLISGKRRTMAFEPDTSVGRVKELVWNSWPAGVWDFAVYSAHVF